MKNRYSTFCSIVFATLSFIVLLSSPAKAHPWGGLVIDSEGNLYFTFICPFVDDDHYACVWKIDTNQELSEVLKSQRSPSDIILSSSPGRNIYAAERNGYSPNFTNTLWEIQGSEVSILISPNRNQDVFFIQAYAVSDNGTIYFAKENQLFERVSNGKISEVKLGKDLGNIRLLEVGNNGELYIMNSSDLYVKTGDNLRLIAPGLKKEDPENIPFRGANIFFDIAIDKNDNIYLAYYGNRKVIRISLAGEIQTILESQAPWSPHGVDVIDGEVYVLESTLGNGKWWKFWEKEDDEIIPRIRKVDNDGEITELFRYSSD
ncbi:MAG: hypothetical protein RLN81_07050 [Balneolaceae bacterium]